MTPTFDNFVVSRLHQRVTWAEKKQKKMISPEVTIFLLVWGGGNFPNKMAKYGNFETELERTK